MTEVSADEYFIVLRAICDRAECLGKSPLGDHVLCELSCTFDIVGSTRADIVQRSCLTGSAAHHHDDGFQQLGAAHVNILGIRTSPCHTGSHAARYNADLLHTLLCLQVICCDSVACLVECGDLLIGSSRDM